MASETWTVHFAQGGPRGPLLFVCCCATLEAARVQRTLQEPRLVRAFGYGVALILDEAGERIDPWPDLGAPLRCMGDDGDALLVRETVDG